MKIAVKIESAGCKTSLTNSPYCLFTLKFKEVINRTGFTMNKCLLCLNLTFNKNALKLSDKQECGSTINEIVKFHFWFHNVRFLNHG